MNVLPHGVADCPRCQARLLTEPERRTRERLQTFGVFLLLTGGCMAVVAVGGEVWKKPPGEAVLTAVVGGLGLFALWVGFTAGPSLVSYYWEDLFRDIHNVNGRLTQRQRDQHAAAEKKARADHLVQNRYHLMTCRKCKAEYAQPDFPWAGH